MTKPSRLPWYYRYSEGRPLTARQKEFMELICLGKTNEEMGQILGVSPVTAKSHVQMILAKLGACNKATAVAKYLKAQMPYGLDETTS